MSLDVFVQTEQVPEAARAAWTAVHQRAVALLVNAEGFTGCVTFGAEGAVVRPLSRVCPGVHLQLGAVAAALATDLTEQRPRVPDVVQPQTQVAAEGSGAEAAAVGCDLFVVFDHVTAALGLGDEAHGAARTPEPLSALVLLQTRLFVEDHPTLGAKELTPFALDQFKPQAGKVFYRW